MSSYKIEQKNEFNKYFLNSTIHYKINKQQQNY